MGSPGNCRCGRKWALCKLDDLRQRRIWRDCLEWAMRTLGLKKELESPVNGAEVGKGNMSAGCYVSEGESGEIIMEGRKDGVTPLSKSLPDVATGVPGTKCFLVLGADKKESG